MFFEKCGAVTRLEGNESGGCTIIEESPVGSDASHGIVKRAVQTVEGQIRVMNTGL